MESRLVILPASGAAGVLHERKRERVHAGPYPSITLLFSGPDARGRRRLCAGMPLCSLSLSRLLLSFPCVDSPFGSESELAVCSVRCECSAYCFAASFSSGSGIFMSILSLDVFGMRVEWHNCSYGIKI